MATSKLVSSTPNPFGHPTDALELAKAVESRTLELICGEMQLVSRVQHPEVIMHGSGVIRVNREGRLTFHMVAFAADFETPSDVTRWWSRSADS